MSLNTALNLLVEEYPKAMKDEFKSNPVANFIRTEIPEYIKEITNDNQRYIIQGSPGKGNWANIPWIAIFDRFITDTVQDGYYVVYLVKEDFSGIYLSLNQGVTTVQKQYGSDAKKALLIKAEDYLARFGKIEGKYITGTIDLSCTIDSRLGLLYEAGSILSIYYEANQIPNDEILAKDLKELLEKYLLLSSKESALLTENEIEDDEENLEYENLQKIRTHKRIERNKKLAAKVKKLKGYTCEACGFNFETKYGVLGKDFIEAHHLIPLHTLQIDKIALDPVRDFSVLCANCHRMIHKSEFVSEISVFRAKYIVN